MERIIFLAFLVLEIKRLQIWQQILTSFQSFSLILFMLKYLAGIMT